MNDHGCRGPIPPSLPVPGGVDEYEPVVDALPLLRPHFVKQRDDRWALPWAMLGAVAQEDSVALLDWYMLERGDFHEEWAGGEIVKKAARFGSRAILQMAIVERKWRGCSSWVCSAAARNGHLDILKWAHEHGCPWGEETCSWAARNGHLEILKWAREHDCPWDWDTCSGAALNGHLEVLKWAREHGCPWDEDTCSGAAQNGHFEILKWARENDCPWDADECAIEARKSGHSKIVEWIRENRQDE